MLGFHCVLRNLFPVYLQVLSSVLQLVLQHADVKLYQVTPWLQLSKSIRTALQQASGNLSYESFKLCTEKLTALANWLPRHAGLVSTLLLYYHPLRWTLLKGAQQSRCSAQAAHSLAVAQCQHCSSAAFGQTLCSSLQPCRALQAATA